MSIRPAKPDDLPELMRMAHLFHDASCYGHIKLCESSLATTFEKLATHERGLLLVGEIDGAIVAMSGAIAQPHWFNERHLIGQELFWWCDPAARGKGVALRLMKAMEEWARTVGCKTFCMASTANLEPEKLRRFYQRRGYVPQDIYYAKEVNHA